MLTLLSAVVLFAAPQAAAPQVFDMNDPKGVSGLSFTIDSELEPIIGQTNAITGEIRFNRANPEKSSGKIIVQTAALKCASQPLTDAMLGGWCLAPDKYPTIEFELKQIKNVRPQKDGAIKVQVTGDFTLHGVTKEVRTEASVKYLANKLRERGGVEGKDGDLLVLRANFQINRRDFNVAKELATAVIGDLVEVKIMAVGVSIK